MKMLPITFAEQYSNACKTFTSFKDSLGYHDYRQVQIQPSIWKYGTYLHIEISDMIYPEIEKKYLHQLCSYDIYDKAEDTIHLTSMQSMIVLAIANGDIRGETAERMIRELYLDLCVNNPAFEMEKWLPELVAWWKDFLDKPPNI